MKKICSLKYIINVENLIYLLFKLYKFIYLTIYKLFMHPLSLSLKKVLDSSFI